MYRGASAPLVAKSYRSFKVRRNKKRGTLCRNIGKKCYEEAEILKAIDDNWEELNKLIDQVFDGKKIHIKRIK